MKKSKRIIAVLLSVILILTTINPAVLAEEVTDLPAPESNLEEFVPAIDSGEPGASGEEVREDEPEEPTSLTPAEETSEPAIGDEEPTGPDDDHSTSEENSTPEEESSTPPKPEEPGEEPGTEEMPEDKTEEPVGEEESSIEEEGEGEESEVDPAIDESEEGQEDKPNEPKEQDQEDEDDEDDEDDEEIEEESGPRHMLTEEFTIGSLTLNSLRLPTSLAEVAKSEFEADDSREMPIHSDSIKYNDWFYGHRVCNPFIDDAYQEQYEWSTVFVSWCADQLGYIDFGHFLRTNDSSELLQWFLENGFTWIRRNDIVPEDEDLCLQISDLIFIPDDDLNYTVGIVTKVTNSYIKYIVGDYNCALAEVRATYDEMSDMTSFVRLGSETIRDDALYAISRFLCKEVGLTPTAACGFLANMYYESMFNPTALGDAMTSYGLCQWHNYRWDRLVEFCEIHDLNWQTAEGQLLYLKYELETYYPDLLEIINQCENSADGAYEAAFYICVDFEQPENSIMKGEDRGYFAYKSVYPALIRQS